MRPITRAARLFTPLVAVLALAACQAEPEEEAAYEADVEDLSGGELVVTEGDAEGIPVDLPETEMTNVPLDAEGNPVEGTTPAPPAE